MLTENFKKFIFIIIFIAIFIFFIFQFRVFFTEPKVIIKSFEETNFLITTNNIFIFEGQAQNSKNFFINGKEILLNTDYLFHKKIYLSPYENIFYIKSITNTGKVFDKKLHIFLKI